MVFAETGEMLSGGNFHGEPVAMASDVMAIAVAELGSISERRIERLVNPALSDLPAFLARDGGVESGLMLAHVTAAALASENKVLAHPACVDSIPTSANKEDHVSMGATAARKAARVVANAARILAVEALAAAQALEFRKPLRTSPALDAAYETLRKRIPAYDGDRFLAPDIELAGDLVRTGALADAAAAVCGRLE
jgi:histidine ammonia-lyase